MEKKETNTLSIFQRPVWVSLFALTAAISWGWAYPLIKMGMEEYQITADMTGSKMLFAGIRFFISGIIILAIARSSHRKFGFKKKAVQENVWFLLLYALLNTTLHYAFFYFGLSHNAGARSAILNSMSVFTVVIFACIFFKSDRMTWRKALGCIIGFLGILALNLGGKESGSFTFLGDGMIILNALCGASASLLTRGLSKRVDVFVGTGYSLSIGGALLVIPALLMGWLSASHQPLGHHHPSAAHCHLNHQFRSLQQIIELQSRRKGSDIQFAHPRSRSHHLLPLSWRNLLLEVSDSRRIGYCRNLYHQ